MKVIKAVEKGKKIRVLGFDDAPFDRQRGSIVNVSGVLCSNTRFEGMLWTEVTKDGNDATETLIEVIKNCKFYEQLHAVLLDGIAFGGFNIIDLPSLADAINLPCIAVMRKHPDLAAIDNALKNFDDCQSRAALILRAGDIYQQDNFVFQCANISADIAFKVLQASTDTGNVPEALRLSHLIGSAIKTGESSNRA